ncbi:MAG: DUF1345 domain-containing protein, partial [Sphingomonas sp.]
MTTARKKPPAKAAAEVKARLGLGQRIAPPRFIAFVVMLALGLAVAIPILGKGIGTMAAFDLASALFLILVAPLLRFGAAEIRRHAKDNDANRPLLLGLSATVSLVVLVSVASELHGGKGNAITTVLLVATLVLAWLFSNTIYGLHYAHLYYSGDDKGADRRGLEIPECDEPDYWDFLYFAFTLGMTFQTS